MHRIFTTAVADVYPHYLAKVERKGRTRAELHEVMTWLTGYDEAALQAHLAARTTFADFFAGARLHPGAGGVTERYWFPAKRYGWGWGAPRTWHCLLYTSPSPRDLSTSRMPSSA